MENKAKICAVIGNPVAHSLSPAIHNAAFKECQLNYCYKAIEVKDSKDAIEEMLENNYRGYSVTIPHKSTVIDFLNEIDPITEKIGAVNTIINDDGYLKGYNTDVSGAMSAIQKVMTIAEKKVAIIGAGGAARAIAYGLYERQADILILNRTLKKAKSLAEEFGCRYSGIDSETVKGFDLIINTTPVGMPPKTNESILEHFPKGITVMDIVYNPIETKFLKLAKAQNCRTINGIGMFLYQAAEQFKLFTGVAAPLKTMKKVLLEKLV